MKSQRPIRLIRSFSTVSGFTLISRVLGFVRDQMLAAFVGPGLVLDAWLAAFRLPNLFRRTFADGAMSMAFVPMFKARLENEDAARAFASGAFTLLWLVLSPLLILLILFMPWIMGVMVDFDPGSRGFDLAVLFGRLMIPYLLLMTLLAPMGAVLDSLGRFGPKAFAPTALNIVLVILLLGIARFDWAAGHILSWGALFAGFAQLLIVWIPAAQMGWAPRFNFGLRGFPIWAFLGRMGSGVIAAGGMQISSLIVLRLATSQEGDLSRLNFADRIYQLPIGLIGVALTTILLSSLSGLIQRGDMRAAQGQVTRALDLTFLLTIPITLACLFHGQFLFAGLFQVGQFSAADTNAAALALAGYAIGIPAAVGQKSLQPLFYAHQNTRTPMFHSLAAVAVAVGLALALHPGFGIFGLALATGVASWTGFLS